MAYDLDRLQSILLNSGLQRKDNSLFQVISTLIIALKEFQNSVGAAVVSSSASISNGPLLTHLADLANFPTSRQLLAGTGVVFDDSVFGERTIDVSSALIADHVVASDGATPVPAPLNDGFGSFIYVMYTP